MDEDEFDQDARGDPEEPETDDEGPNPRWSSKVRTLVLVLQGTAAAVNIVDGVSVLFHR